MLGGKVILASRKFVEGSHKMHSWSDTCNYEYDIEYDGEITTVVAQAVCDAWDKGPEANPKYPTQATLRRNAGEKAIKVDRERRKLITEQTTMLCD